MNPKTTYAIAEFSSCGGASESSHGARPQDANATESTGPEQSSATSHATDDSADPALGKSVALPDVDNSQTEPLQERTIANCPDSCVCDGDRDSESSAD